MLNHYSEIDIDNVLGVSNGKKFNKVAVSGTWGNLPVIGGLFKTDRGWTEAITGGNWGGKAMNNPQIASAPTIYKSPYTNTTTSTQKMSSSNPPMSTGGNVLGAATGPTYGGGAPTGNNGGSGDNGGNNGGGNPADPQYSGPSDEELENAYKGASAQLDTSEANLRGQQPLTEAEILRQGNAMKSPYDTRESEGSADLARQQTQTSRAEQNAQAQARQLFNELSQYNVGRFGGGSSTGGAAAELLGRTTQQQMGNVTATAAENMQKIADAGRALKDFVFKAKSGIDEQVNSKIAQAQEWFKGKLREIDANRESLASDKSARKYEALQARSNFVTSINQAKWQYEMDLKNWYDKELASTQMNAQGYNVVDTTPIIQGIGTQSEQFAKSGIARVNTPSTPILAKNYGQNNPGLGSYGGYVNLGNGLWQDKYGQTVSEDQVLGNSGNNGNAFGTMV